MSFFGVTIETIASLDKIPKADRLLKCTLKGLDFEFVVGKDDWKVGDKCLYIPLDSILPEELAEKLGVKGKLSGAQKNRVKTVRLRGQISQGLIGPLDLVFKGESGIDDTDSEALTKHLGVTKYEPPEKHIQGLRGTRVKITTLPLGQTVYDIEGAERNAGAVTQLAYGIGVVITEKMEGSNFSATWLPDEKRIAVNTRKHEIVLDGSAESKHPFIDQFLEQNLMEIMVQVRQKYKDMHFTLYGEFCGPGVQKNIYKLEKPLIYLFDIKVGTRYLEAEEFYAFTEGYCIAPILAYDVDLVEWINAQCPEDWDHEEQQFSIKHASNGKSMILDRSREGIVIRPMLEQYSPDHNGRLIIKQRSPEYLAKDKN